MGVARDHDLGNHINVGKPWLANIAFHHVAPGGGLPVPGAWIVHAPKSQKTTGG